MTWVGTESVSENHAEYTIFFFFSSRRRHTRSDRDWSSDVCSSDLTSSSPLLSGPRPGFPRLPGRNAVCPANAPAFHVRTASKTPGARPAKPYAARSLAVPSVAGQKGSSEITYEADSFGYACSPKLLPNALLPSTRNPPLSK